MIISDWLEVSSARRPVRVEGNVYTLKSKRRFRVREKEKIRNNKEKKKRGKKRKENLAASSLCFSPNFERVNAEFEIAVDSPLHLIASFKKQVER